MLLLLCDSGLASSSPYGTLGLGCIPPGAEHLSKMAYGVVVLLLALKCSSTVSLVMCIHYAARQLGHRAIARAQDWRIWHHRMFCTSREWLMQSCSVLLWHSTHPTWRLLLYSAIGIDGVGAGFCYGRRHSSFPPRLAANTDATLATLIQRAIDECKVFLATQESTRTPTSRDVLKEKGHLEQLRADLKAKKEKKAGKGIEHAAATKKRIADAKARFSVVKVQISQLEDVQVS